MRGRQDSAAPFRHTEQGIGNGRHSRGHGNRRGPAIERGDPLFQDRHGGVAHPRIEVAVLVEAEQPLHPLRIPQFKRRRLIDRDRNREIVLFGVVPAPDLQGIKTKNCLCHKRTSKELWDKKRPRRSSLASCFSGRS